MFFSGHHQLKAGYPHLSRQAQWQVRPGPTGTALHSPAVSSGATLVPHASSGRSGGAKSPQRGFSVMQSAMKIPGLASALNLIGVPTSGPSSSSTSGDSTVAAAGGSGTTSGGLPVPEDQPLLPASPPHQQQPPHSQLRQAADSDGGGLGQGQRASAPAAAASGTTSDAADAVAAAAEVVYDLAAAAAASNGNGHVPHQLPNNPLPNNPQQQQGHQHHTAEGGPQGVRQLNGVVNGYVNGVAHRRTSDGAEAPLSVTEPGLRAENNITPYTGSGPSLAVQIREIASSLRQINALRLEYLDKIAQQEMELAAKDQVLRSREERIQSLEREATELRRSLGLLHSAKSAAEAEVQRLRAAASAAAAAPPPALPAPEAMPVPAAAAVAPVPESPASPPPHPLTAPPTAVVGSAPATVAACPMPAPMPAPTPAPPPPPPPPPRVPEVVLSYRSSWPEAFLHCNVEGRGWTAVPGLRMEHTASKEYVVRVQGRSVEFVLTNGHGEWDSPGGAHGRNYRVDMPGEYRLHYGALTQAKAWQP